MINLLQGLKPQICNKHNQPITLFQQGQPVCQICINQQPGNMTIDQFYQQLEKNLLKQNQENEQQHQLLQSILNSLINYQTNINNHLEKILQLIKEQIGLVKIQEQNIESMIQKSNNQQKLIDELEEEVIKTSKSNQSVRILIENLLLDFKQKLSNIDQFVGLLKQNPIQDIQNMTNIAMPAVHQNISNKFEYQIMEKNSLNGIFGFSFVFNRVNDILVVGSYKEIIIYEFNSGKISKELQRSDGYTEGANCLYFMKKSNEFISGSLNKSIIIWELNQNNQFVVKQTLKDHENFVYCLLMNKNEDLLISGSADETIKFWRVQNERWKFWRVQNGRWNCVQSIEQKHYVHDLKLNEMENKLISCGCDQHILVYEISESNQEWTLAQTIKTSEFGYRLCFTIEDQFVFQPATQDYLEIYDYDNLKKQFYKLKQVQIQCCKICFPGFPCQFIRQLNILTVKHGNYLNIFRACQDGNYQLIQTIEYQNAKLQGRMTDNGEYLITNVEVDIQFRKLVQLQ